MSPINIFLFLFSTLLLFQYVYTDPTCKKEGETGCDNDTHDGYPCCAVKGKNLQCQQTGIKTYSCINKNCISQNGPCSGNSGCCYGNYCHVGRCHQCLPGEC
ncbi:unnamed protein product [Meloidogyne enterolobii]|uniref:Uncharacterized protein n=1 Tax=Meloidogyne enterolobii TaxID=390850 RepID=A0ACB0XQ27_MELEN